MRLISMWLIAVGVAGSAAVAAQEAASLVVIVTGDSQFHQAGCAVVARAGSKVTVAKRGEAARRGLTPHDCGPDAGGPASDPNAVKVATQPGDNKYHRLACGRLKSTRSTVTLEEAGRKWWPCPACKPPIRQRKAVHGTNLNNPNVVTTDANDGRINSTAGPARQMQLGARLEF